MGLLPCAVGATAIEHWVPGGALFEHMIQRVNAAREATQGSFAPEKRLSSHSKKRGRVGGPAGRRTVLLFYQGESDAVDELLARKYVLLVLLVLLCS